MDERRRNEGPRAAADCDQSGQIRPFRAAHPPVRPDDRVVSDGARARIVFRDERLRFLSYDDEHHRLALIHIPDLPPRDPERAGTTMSRTPIATLANCWRPIDGSKRTVSYRIGRSTTA